MFLVQSTVSNNCCHNTDCKIMESKQTFTTKTKKDSLGRDLNPRPNAYEAFALPG